MSIRSTLHRLVVTAHLAGSLTGCARECPEGFLRDNDGNCLYVPSEGATDAATDTAADADADADADTECAPEASTACEGGDVVWVDASPARPVIPPPAIRLCR